MNVVKTGIVVLLAATGVAVAEEALKPAKLATVSEAPVVLERTFFGQVAARRSVDLAFQVPGQIVEFPVLEGFTIPEGGLIAKLDQEPFELEYNQARLQKEQAERTVKRLERLTGSTVSEVAVEDAETTAALANIKLRNAEWALHNATLHAPFEGLVSSRNTDLFATVATGTPVVRIHDMSELRIEVDVPEILFQRADDDDGVEIIAEFPAREGEFPLEIREFDAETSNIGQTFRITFGMEAPDDGSQILPGSSVTVRARIQQPAMGISVPPTALVVNEAGDVGVMQFTPIGADEGTVMWTKVDTEPDQSGVVRITAGLDDGSEIVVTGGGALQDGQSVRRFCRLRELSRDNRMSIARTSIEKPLYTWLIVLVFLLGGLWGFASLGRLEDPAFTIKQTVIVTQYPGATAEQVALEVSEPLESAIQKMAEVDTITSINQPGQSIIEVEIKSTYDGDELPEIWTKLRARVRDAARGLPAGATVPMVNDSFGDVFGIFYAVTADGYSDAERHDLATFLRRELLTVRGVADVDVSGLPAEAIFVEPDLSLSVNQNIPVDAINIAISTADSVFDAGAVETGATRTVILAPEGSDTVAAIAGLSVGVGGHVVNLIDLANVYRGRQSDQDLIIRHDGTEAFTLGIAGIATENIVEVGKAVDAKIAELSTDIPYGVELHPIYQQHVVVEDASNNFLVSLAMSVTIVVAVLAVFMGWRAAIVVGSTLLLTVVGTFFFMALMGIEMERISLGALIIAMGMLVDNAIVVAEGMQVTMQRGKRSVDAAEDVAGKTQIPLLGATVIGIMAFAGIGLSPDATGEFLFSLFAVIAISLLLSWLLAITVTPLLGHHLFKQGSGSDDDAYGGALFRAYGATLRLALRLRWLVVVGLIAITAVCYAGFGSMKQQFFPNSNTPLFFVHYKLPQGTPIETTSAHLEKVEAWLEECQDVVSVTIFVGQGATRFMLTYAAEKPNLSYGHLIIRTDTIEDIPGLQEDLEAFGREAFPEGEFRTKRLVFGPGGGDPIQVRFSGSDPAVLRHLATEARKSMEAASQNVIEVRNDWREQEVAVRPIYATNRAQTAGVNRDDIAAVLKFSTEGTQAGVFRERERQIPIIVRRPSDGPYNLSDQIVFSENARDFVPIEQMVDGFNHEAQNTLVHRRNRVLTITVGADIPSDMTAAAVFSEIRAAVEAIDLPVGYTIEWGGEFESSTEAQQSLAGQLPISLVIMVLISVLLFNAVRQPIIIWLLVPMSVNGVVIGLLGTGLPFTFTALLGLLSLSGMLIKNGIVLVEEIDLVRKEGLPIRDAIVTASVSRLRPVMLAAITTILGMVPLLSDAFFVSMAVTIMGGLAFATILTLVAAPVFYMFFFARDERKAVAARAVAA